MDDLRIGSASAVRSAIAGLIIPAQPERRIGCVRLHPHQAYAEDRLRAAISRFGGALLCDPVGTGKTFTALAVASRYESVTIVAPAVLKPMWVRSSAMAGVRARFISHESLSRTTAVRRARGLVIVDEAHHARNPSTKRYRALRKLVDGVHTLLATATPVHNNPRDLTALQSLYLGEHAALLDASEFAETVIRRETVVGIMPQVAPVVWLTTPHDARMPEQILGLPPALPPRDGGEADTLVRYSLVRQWASSDAALRLALKRRLQRAAAIIAALEAGRYPTHSELSAWAIGNDAVQLAFPELVAARSGNISDLLPVVRAHAGAVERLLSQLSPDSPRDHATAALIRDLRSRHAKIPIVAFSSYEETVAMLFSALAPDGGIGALAGNRGRVAGGRVPRREIIERFAPVASGCAAPLPANHVSLLLATDVLSEGVNLQDAGVVIHLDLPFTNARLDQRVGRLARLGSPHARIQSYAFRPPAPAEVIARIESLLGVKLSFEADARAIPELSAEVTQRLMLWSGPTVVERVVATVEADHRGFLAVVRSGTGNRLLAGTDHGLTDSPAGILHAIDQAEGPGMATDRNEVMQSILAIRMHVALEASLVGSVASPSRRAIHRRIARAVVRARPHERARFLALAHRAREAADHRGGGAFDSALVSILEADADDDFLERLSTLDLNRKDEPHSPVEVLALLLFVARDR